MKKQKEEPPPRWPVAWPWQGEIRDGPRSRDLEKNVARQFLVWAKNSQTREKLFGPPMTEFIMRNLICAQFGQEPWERSDIPPGENWDVPLLTSLDRHKCFFRIVGVRGFDEHGNDLPLEEEEGEEEQEQEATPEQPPAQSAEPAQT
jgi:hypothetical protein